ncbi:UNVERIFIED_CONTAM: putative inactive leucine-rich repeat receptor-like protein kinase [Sesamum radiatum]|uniref:Inactive leucine-rich repeat receptor-like protein kinase n=1 Tax=Sesamum radiatum TaxID=300843 RepID=A0AAW2V6K7_SESRA
MVGQMMIIMRCGWNVFWRRTVILVCGWRIRDEKDATTAAAFQYEALVKIKQLLKFPEELSSWSENQDFCNSEPTQILTLACYEDNITQLHVTGTYWFPHLSQDFSTAALFSNIAALPYLKVLSLVSIGLKGPLPSGIGEFVFPGNTQHQL